MALRHLARNVVNALRIGEKCFFEYELAWLPYQTKQTYSLIDEKQNCIFSVITNNYNIVSLSNDVTVTTSKYNDGSEGSSSMCTVEMTFNKSGKYSLKCDDISNIEILVSE